MDLKKGILRPSSMIFAISVASMPLLERPHMEYTISSESDNVKMPIPVEITYRHPADLPEYPFGYSHTVRGVVTMVTTSSSSMGQFS